MGLKFGQREIFYSIFRFAAVRNLNKIVKTILYAKNGDFISFQDLLYF